MIPILGFPGGDSGKKSTCQCRKHKRCWFDPWVGAIPWRRKWQLTPVFLPGKIPWTEEPSGLQFQGGHKDSDMTKLLSTLAEKTKYAIPLFKTSQFFGESKFCLHLI